MSNEHPDGDTNIEYVEATYRIPLGFGLIPQIRCSLIHFHNYLGEYLEGESESEILQIWVEEVLDSNMDNDWARLGEIGERP